MQVAYATDTYGLQYAGFLHGAQDMIHRNGRITTALVYWLAAKLDLTITLFYSMSYVLAILFYLLAMILLDKMTRLFIQNENLRILLCLLLIVNPFIAEYFMFIEMFAFALAILLEVAATYALCRRFATGQEKYCALAVMLLLLAFMSYQASTGLFIILTMPFAYYYVIGTLGTEINDDIHFGRRYIIHLAMTAFTYLTSAVLYVFIFKFLLQATRQTAEVESEPLSAILQNAIESFEYMLQTTCRILPEYVYLVFVGIAFACCLLVMFHVKGKGLWLFHIVCSVIVLMASSAVPAVVGGYFAPRTAYPLGCLVGILLLNATVAVQNWGGWRSATYATGCSTGRDTSVFYYSSCNIRPLFWKNLYQQVSNKLC